MKQVLVRWIILMSAGRLTNYSKEIDMDNVWSQVYYLAYYDNSFKAELTHQDVIENELEK